MSLRSLGVRSALAAASVSALAVAAAAPAQAATLSQTYSCLYPLISSQPLTVDIDAAIPESATVGVPTGEFTIVADSTTNETTWDGLNLVQAKTIEGTANATSSVTLPGGFVLPLSVPVNVPVTNVPATRGPINIIATGNTPSLTFTSAGEAPITVDAIKLNLRAKKADGTSVIFPPTPGVPDSDGLPETFDVPCTLSPAGQNKLLTTIAILPAVDPKPTKPGPIQLDGTPTATTAPIKWAASTDDEGVTEYEISYDDVKITVPGTQTSTTLTGLLPDSEYFIKVVAKDADGNVSDPSDEFQLLTPAEEPTDTPPTKPTGLAGDPDETSVALTWTASTDDKGVDGYDVFQDGVKIDTVTGTSKTVTGLTPETAYKFKVQAIDTIDQTSEFSDEITVTTDATPVDTPPSKPTGLAGTPTSTSIALSWIASTDDDAVTGYDVFQDGVKIDTVTGTTKTITGLTPETAYDLKVVAKDTAGQTTESDEITVTTLAPPVDNPPTAPTGLAGIPTKTSVALSWTAATDDNGVTGYDVFQDGVKVQSVTGLTATITGLTPNTEYDFKVQAKDAKPQTGPFSTEVTVKTLEDIPDQTVDYSYDLTGSSQLKTLTRGTVPLSGGFDAKLTLATGEFTGDLDLDPTKARLKALGFLPITADIAFVPTAPTTGKLEGGSITATSKFKVRLPKLYLFGSIPLSNSQNCQTRTASVADLKSDGPFNPLSGGKLTGTYALSSLTGCGAFTGLISPLTAGKGNTIDINLTSAAPSAT